MENLLIRWQIYCGRHPVAFWFNETLEAALLFTTYMVYILLIILGIFVAWLLLPYIAQLFPYSTLS